MRRSIIWPGVSSASASWAATPSVLNPIFYGLSFGIGASAGLISDRISLGFVAATEDRVCKHLDDHLGQLPAGMRNPEPSSKQMRDDEAQHSTAAIEAGGLRFPAPVKFGMSRFPKS